MAKLITQSTHINKQPIGKSNENKPFVTIDKEVFQAARKDLTPYEFYIWTFFAENADGWTIHWTATGIATTLGLGATTVYKYIDSLINKGYLAQRIDGVYEFFENPKDSRREKVGNTIVYNYN